MSVVNSFSMAVQIQELNDKLHALQKISQFLKVPDVVPMNILQHEKLKQDMLPTLLEMNAQKKPVNEIMHQCTASVTDGTTIELFCPTLQMSHYD